MSGSKRRYKTLRATPVARPTAPAESAARTDAHIRAGMHPLAAYQASRQGEKPRRRKGRTGVARPCRVCGQNRRECVCNEGPWDD